MGQYREVHSVVYYICTVLLLVSNIDKRTKCYALFMVLERTLKSLFSFALIVLVILCSGIELGRRLGLPLFGLTTPLLTTSTGAKMGKSVDGAVWLNRCAYANLPAVLLCRYRYMATGN